MTVQFALHELRVMLRSPFAWCAAGALQFLIGWLFLASVESYIELQTTANARGLTHHLIVHILAPVSVLFIIATPLFCMHTIAGEQQANRLNLLLSLPVTAKQIVIGKFLAAAAFQFMILFAALLLLVILSSGTTIDLGHLFYATVGLVLFVATQTALTLFFSALTKRPILAGFLSFITSALLWMAAATSANGILLFASPSAHLRSFMHGLIDTRDIIFYFAASAMLLTVCIWRFDARRIRSEA